MTPREFDNYMMGQIKAQNIQNRFNTQLALLLYNMMGQIWAKDFIDEKIENIYSDNEKQMEKKGMTAMKKAKADQKKLTEIMSEEGEGGSVFDKAMEKMGKQEIIRIPKKG